MSKRKVGDRVIVKSKYFNSFNDLEGSVTNVDYEAGAIAVDIDYHGIQVFSKSELKGAKKKCHTNN